MAMRQFAIAAAFAGIASFTGSAIWFGLMSPKPADLPRPAAPPPVPEPAEARPPRPSVAEPSAEPAAAESAAPAPLAPSFDIVRVEPGGEAVIAGRGAPNAIVELLRNGRAHARGVADASGLFALVPPPLPPGDHEIVLKSIAPDGARARSRESVTVSVFPDRTTRPLVALASPDRPTVLLSNPEPPPEPREARAPAPGGATPGPGPGGPEPARPEPGRPEAPRGEAAKPAPRPEVKILTVEAEGTGSLLVSGRAAPGATVRLYLNDALIAPGGAGGDGRVSFAIGRGVRPGEYRVRLDDVDPVSGEVKTRAEVSFTVPALPEAPLAARRPAEVASSAPAGLPAPPDRPVVPPPVAARAGAAERSPDVGTVTVPEVSTAIVARGDNLWSISRRIYGRGTRYTVIYGANQPQIRDPGLIYPGQVFVLPPEGGARAD